MKATFQVIEIDLDVIYLNMQKNEGCRFNNESSLWADTSASHLCFVQLCVTDRDVIDLRKRMTAFESNVQKSPEADVSIMFSFLCLYRS